MHTLLIALTVGVVSALVGALVGHRLGLHQARHDDCQREIFSVAERYHVLRQTNRSSGAHGLMQCGVLGLRNSAEVELAIRRIREFGHSDPLGPNRAGLARKDVWHFFKVANDNKINLLQLEDLQKAYELTRNE